MSAAMARCALWANDLTRLCLPLPPGREYVFVEVRPDRLALELATTMGVEEDHVHGRLERGCRAFVWAWHAEVVSWLWVSTGEETAPPRRRTLHFSTGDCYAWNAGTLEGHRGRGLFAGLLVYAGRQMARAGCHTMWGGILDANRASQRANATAGFRPILRVIVVHEAPTTRLRMRAADYADERLVERARGLFGEGLACRPTAEHPATGLAAVQRVRDAGMAGVSDEAALRGLRRVVGRAKRASTGGRSAHSIWTCDLRGHDGARAGVKLTRRSLAAGEPLPVVVGEMGCEAARVRSVAFGRLPAQAGADAGTGPAAISKNVEAIDIFWRRTRPATMGRRGTDAVTRCPPFPEGSGPTVEDKEAVDAKDHQQQREERGHRSKDAPGQDPTWRLAGGDKNDAGGAETEGDGEAKRPHREKDIQVCHRKENAPGCRTVVATRSGSWQCVRQVVPS